MKTTTLFRIIN